MADRIAGVQAFNNLIEALGNLIAEGRAATTCAAVLTTFVNIVALIFMFAVDLLGLRAYINFNRSFGDFTAVLVFTFHGLAGLELRDTTTTKEPMMLFVYFGLELVSYVAGIVIEAIRAGVVAQRRWGVLYYRDEPETNFLQPYHIFGFIICCCQVAFGVMNYFRNNIGSFENKVMIALAFVLGICTIAKREQRIAMRVGADQPMVNLPIVGVYGSQLVVHNPDDIPLGEAEVAMDG